MSAPREWSEELFEGEPSAVEVVDFGPLTGDAAAEAYGFDPASGPDETAVLMQFPLPPHAAPQLHTRSVTLVIQRVCTGDESFTKQVALALLEYAADCLNGTGGNGQFERHVTANRCRIEAIASIAPVPGDEAREGLSPTDALGSLRDRLELALEMANYLPGGENAGEITTALGYSPEEAASELRAKLTEALEALPE